jgi:hypothetical protein
MKTLVLCASGLVFLGSAYAADPGLPKFGGEQIGVPPLSLRESIRSNKNDTNLLPSAPGMQARSDSLESPELSPKLLPRVTPPVMPSTPRNPRAPRVSRDGGMPIILPSEAVDYAMTIVPPDPTVDFKMVIKEPAVPSKKAERDPAK